jgi:hypothetical protein
MKGLFDNLTLRSKDREGGESTMLRGNSNLGESLLGGGDSADNADGHGGYTPPVLDQDAPEVSGKLKVMIKVGWCDIVYHTVG